jgi:alpha-glucosidase (family GH31 glycosyl hydrolase)
MKPLAYVWPDDEATYGISDEYLLGPSFLVAPIVEAGGRRTVYLPAGTWYDYYDPSVSFAGSQTISVTEPLERIPVFVRGNSIYVTGNVSLGTVKVWDQSAKTALTISVMPGNPGDSTSFEFVDCFDKDQTKAIGLERDSDAVTVTAPAFGEPLEIYIRCDGFTSATLNGTQVEGKFDAANHSAHFSIHSGEPIHLRMTANLHAR